jgi:hypothetical protein
MLGGHRVGEGVEGLEISLPGQPPADDRVQELDPEVGHGGLENLGRFSGPPVGADNGREAGLGPQGVGQRRGGQEHGVRAGMDRGCREDEGRGVD